MNRHQTVNPQRTNAILYPLAAYTLWGLLPLYWKELKILPADHILAHRILWSFLFLSVILSLTGQWKELKPIFKKPRTLAAVGLASLLISLNWYIYIWAVNSNHIVEASLGYYINPILTIALGTIVLHESMDKWQKTALALAFSGVLILTWQVGKPPWVALSLASTFALYGLAKKMSSLNPLTGLSAETLFIAPVALIYLLNDGNQTVQYATLPSYTWILILFTGVATSIPLLLFAHGAKKVSFITLGFVQYLSPSLSLLLGVFLYHEPFTKMHAWSFGLIWMAILLYSLTRRR